MAGAPIEAQQIRILMRSGSGTAAPGSTDVRDGLGAAVREISAGHSGAGGLVDHVVEVARVAMVTAYVLRRPDGRLSVLLFNKDPARTVTVALRTGSAAANAPLAGGLELFSYSGEQWDRYPEGGETNGGFPEKNDPPARTVVDAAAVLDLRGPYGSRAFVVGAGHRGHALRCRGKP